MGAVLDKIEDMVDELSNSRNEKDEKDSSEESVDSEKDMLLDHEFWFAVEAEKRERLEKHRRKQRKLANMPMTKIQDDLPHVEQSAQHSALSSWVPESFSIAAAVDSEYAKLESEDEKSFKASGEDAKNTIDADEPRNG